MLWLQAELSTNVDTVKYSQMFVRHVENLQKPPIVVSYDLFMCLMSVWKTLSCSYCYIRKGEWSQSGASSGQWTVHTGELVSNVNLPQISSIPHQLSPQTRHWRKFMPALVVFTQADSCFPGLLLLAEIFHHVSDSGWRNVCMLTVTVNSTCMCVSADHSRRNAQLFLGKGDAITLCNHLHKNLLLALSHSYTHELNLPPSLPSSPLALLTLVLQNTFL